jgi:hypothetical protein
VVKDTAGYQQTRLSGLRAVLHRNITAWIACQNIYMPAVIDVRTSEKPVALAFEDAISALQRLDISSSTERTDHSAPFSTGIPASAASSVPPPQGPSGAFPMPDPLDELQDGVVAPPDEVVRAENVLLLLPSAVPAAHRGRICSDELICLERRFRMAQMADALSRLRKALRVFAVSKSNYKGELSAGTKHGTKTRTHLKSLWAKVTSSAVRYRVARSAMLALDPSDLWLWQDRFRELLNADIRGPYAGDDNSDMLAVKTKRRRDAGAGYVESSWIWLVQDGDQPTEQVRVHWSKVCAYADRWEEELVILPKEMLRTLLYFEWEAAWWFGRVNQRVCATRPLLTAALNAYAFRQASMRRKRITVFAQTWIPLLREHRARLSNVDWQEDYEDLVDWELAAKRKRTAEARAAKRAARRQGKPGARPGKHLLHTSHLSA